MAERLTDQRTKELLNLVGECQKANLPQINSYEQARFEHTLNGLRYGLRVVLGMDDVGLLEGLLRCSLEGRDIGDVELDNLLRGEKL